MGRGYALNSPRKGMENEGKERGEVIPHARADKGWLLHRGREGGERGGDKSKREMVGLGSGGWSWLLCGHANNGEVEGCYT